MIGCAVSDDAILVSHDRRRRLLLLLVVHAHLTILMQPFFVLHFQAALSATMRSLRRMTAASDAAFNGGGASERAAYASLYRRRLFVQGAPAGRERDCFCDVHVVCSVR
jgi:hypothetical protein